MGLPFVSLFDDLAEAIASPPPNRPLARAVGNFGRRVCDGISNNPAAYAPTALQAPLRAVCQPYWDNEGYSAPIVRSPFTGGQCGLGYSPTGSYVRNCGFTAGELRPWRILDQRTGPVLGVNVIDGSYVVVFANNVVMGIVDSATGRGLLNVGPGTPVACTQISQQDDAARDVQLLAVNPQGHGDTCGNPPNVVEPGPNPAPNPGPLPEGTGPGFSLRGVPILVLPPTLEINPSINIEIPDGEINIGGGQPSLAAEPVLPGTPIPGDPNSPNGGDTDFGEPPGGERWVGCCITITGRPVGSGTIPAAEPESIYPTTVGNVRLKFKPFGMGAFAYDTPLRKREKTTCVWEPVRGLNPTGVRVNVISGYSYVVTPHSVPEEQ